MGSNDFKVDEPSQKAVAVDPFDVEKVSAAAIKENVEITGGLTTHHHADHSGGNEVRVLTFFKQFSYKGIGIREL